MPKGLLAIKSVTTNLDTKKIVITYDFASDNGYSMTDVVAEINPTNTVSQLNNAIKQDAAQKMAANIWGTFANSDIVMFGGAS
jgi:hypothetical protein